MYKAKIIAINGIIAFLAFFPLSKTYANTTADTNKHMFFTNSSIPAGTGSPDSGEWDQICQCNIWVTGTGYKECSQWECNQQVPKIISSTTYPTNELLDYFNFNTQLIVFSVGFILALLIAILLINLI